MLIKDIVELYNKGKVPGGYFWGYAFGLNKLKILSVYTLKGHSAFVVDCKTGLTDVLDGYKGEYFLTAKEAIDYEIKCCQEAIDRKKKEIERLKEEKKKL